MRHSPGVTTWADHEVENDYADDVSPAQPDPRRFLVQRAAACQACWEHMPVPLALRPEGPSLRLCERYRFGDLVEFHVRDDRQYRSHLACQADLPRSAVMHGCGERLDPRRTMLGAAQVAWFDDGPARASTRWTIIAQETLMAKLDRDPRKKAVWHDGWDGYHAVADHACGAHGKCGRQEERHRSGALPAKSMKLVPASCLPARITRQAISCTRAIRPAR